MTTDNCQDETNQLKSTCLRGGRVFQGKADLRLRDRYRDHWFWIDDGDLKSKRAFAFMMLLFTLSDPSEKENLPLITIPAQ